MPKWDARSWCKLRAQTTIGGEDQRQPSPASVFEAHTSCSLVSVPCWPVAASPERLLLDCQSSPGNTLPASLCLQVGDTGGRGGEFLFAVPELAFERADLPVRSAGMGMVRSRLAEGGFQGG